MSSEVVTERSVRFVVDTMLGDIARWLRVLGYDTLYSRDFEDWKILKIAERDDRIIITRDVGLFRRALRRGLRAVLLDITEVPKELAKIALKTGIRLQVDFSRTRCPHCNSPLRKVTNVAEIAPYVPPTVRYKYREFWFCDKCKKAYWVGNHWKTINKILEESQQILAKMKKKSMK
ncbi:MAG: hypothetical protein DRO18_04480 [Thermoprotei archaeon]|nr:MAG: hypothetical protein DRO18_04480 [Thermoprotei archaeon]